MKKTIILKNRNTGLLINFDPKEIDLTELSIDTVGTNVFIVYGDYEVIQAKSKKDAETSIEEIKKEISQLIIDNEEEAYDYYDAMIMRYLSEEGHTGTRFVLEKDGEIIDSGTFVN